MSNDFFDEPEEHSRIKSQIVSKYFAIWASIMATRSQRIGYFDFFAGPGRYGSGEPSTPLKILGHAIGNPILATRLVSVFNDADPEHIKRLRQEIARLPKIDTLRYQPQFRTGLVSDELVEQFEQTSTIPALSFLDPWGYKGLSLRSIGALMKDWGCEVIFFFNHNRINMGITNPSVQEHMEALFGTEILVGLKQDVSERRPADREALIEEALDRALQEAGWEYLLPFAFRRESGRVSHYICFVSKHPLGFSIMKKVMAGVGRKDEDGVPLFDYVPGEARMQLPLGGSGRLTELADDLLSNFAGQTVSVEEVCEIHGESSRFIDKNYKDALKNLEANGDITCSPDVESPKRRKNTLADWVNVTFPPA